ncbi:MAG: hypothetical protein M1816_003787 [Peltula sp. TS41687]|nr:MAG: hypothetical protein M1816_003787 [Peltula sp. TS41687]
MIVVVVVKSIDKYRREFQSELARDAQEVERPVAPGPDSVSPSQALSSSTAAPSGAAHERAHDALAHLVAHGYKLVEWAVLLTSPSFSPTRTSKAPLGSSSSHAISRASTRTTCTSGTAGALELQGRHFLIGTGIDAQHPISRRPSLFPRSWAGFQDTELQPANLELCPTTRPAGLAVLTVSPASTFAAVLFDPSYEGDCEVFVEDEEKEREERDRALEEFGGWTWWLDGGEMWIVDVLEAIVAGRARGSTTCLARRDGLECRVLLLSLSRRTGYRDPCSPLPGTSSIICKASLLLYVALNEQKQGHYTVLRSEQTSRLRID